MPPNEATPPQRVISEPRLIALALLAGAVGILGVIAIVVTDDAWIVIVTVVAMAVTALALVIDLYRVMDRDAPESRGDD